MSGTYTARADLDGRLSLCLITSLIMFSVLGKAMRHLVARHGERLLSRYAKRRGMPTHWCERKTISLFKKERN